MTDDTARTSPFEDGPNKSDSPLELDTILELLANRHRRFALYALTQTGDGVIPLDELFEEVATLIAAIEGEAVTSEVYEEIAPDLYHWHLPVLADLSLIDCDGRRGTIRYHRDPFLETWVNRIKQFELA